MKGKYKVFLVLNVKMKNKKLHSGMLWYVNAVDKLLERYFDQTGPKGTIINL